MVATATVKTRAARTPSQFKVGTKITVLTHSSIGPVAGVGTLSELFEQTYGGSYAVRAVHRTRAAGGVDKVPSLSVYLAPLGYEFAKVAERGVRLDSDIADLLRGIAVKMGLNPNDSKALNAVAKAIAEKAAK